MSLANHSSYRTLALFSPSGASMPSERPKWGGREKRDSPLQLDGWYGSDDTHTEPTLVA